MTNPDKTKLCFVIGPIGEPGSPERKLADFLLRGIIKPVLETTEFNYTVKRADEIAEPGMISDQAITAAMNAELVVADLTGRNPNAFYELAIRHMSGKAAVHMIRAGELPPFDLKDYRAIAYANDDIDIFHRAQSELASQVRVIETTGYEVHNPVTKAQGYQKLATSGDSRDKMIADMTAKMDRLASTQLDIMEEVNRLTAMQAAGFTPPGLLNVSSGGLFTTASTVHGISTGRGIGTGHGISTGRGIGSARGSGDADTAEGGIAGIGGGILSDVADDNKK